MIAATSRRSRLWKRKKGRSGTGSREPKPEKLVALKDTSSFDIEFRSGSVKTAPLIASRRLGENDAARRSGSGSAHPMQPLRAEWLRNFGRRFRLRTLT